MKFWDVLEIRWYFSVGLFRLNVVSSKKLTNMGRVQNGALVWKNSIWGDFPVAFPPQRLECLTPSMTLRFMGACLDKALLLCQVCGESIWIRSWDTEQWIPQVFDCLVSIQEIHLFQANDSPCVSKFDSWQDAPVMCITEYMPGGDLERYYMVPWFSKPKKSGEDG